MKKVLRISAVVLFFLVWLGWCFSDALFGFIQRLSAEPEISVLTMVFLGIGFLFAAALVIVALTVVLVIVLIIAKITLHAAGFHDEAKAVDTFFDDNHSLAFIVCLVIFAMLIITAITKTNFFSGTAQ